MDVSRIEAVSPKQIDWRKLTAKEIIKYDSQGIDVPAEYLQWAKQFRADITANDKDETTYEMATSSTNILQKVETEQASTTNNSTEEPQTTTPSDEEKEPTAKELRKSMEDEGASLYKLGKTFRDLSGDKEKDSKSSDNISSSSAENSSNSIEGLDNYMSELMSQISEVKAEINSEKGKKNDSRISRINRLMQQLKMYGSEGQSTAAGYNVDLNNLQAIVEGQSGTIESGLDYGTETSEIGNEIKRFLWYRGFGKRVIRAGDAAVDASENARTSQQNALSSIKGDLDTVISHQTNISSQTGVGAISESKNNKDADANGDKKSDSEKAIQTAQNDGTDTTAKSTTDLDTILKAKIRRGEEVQT